MYWDVSIPKTLIRRSEASFGHLDAHHSLKSQQFDANLSDMTAGVWGESEPMVPFKSWFL